MLENVIELGNTETVKSCVAGDLGIALLPRFAVEQQLADGTLQAVESDFSRESITAVCSHHKNKWVTPAMELFMELTREHFAALRQPEGQQAKERIDFRRPWPGGRRPFMYALFSLISSWLL